MILTNLKNQSLLLRIASANHYTWQSKNGSLLVLPELFRRRPKRVRLSSFAEIDDQ
jgi:hypothetical protein